MTAVALTPGQHRRRPTRMAISFARTRRLPSGRIAPEGAIQVTRARHSINACLRACQLPDSFIGDFDLVVSELVTNALDYGAGAEINLRLTCTFDEVRLEVEDGSRNAPCLQTPTSDSESGRGLFIVEALTKEYSGSWGTSNNNTTTWCSLSPYEGSDAIMTPASTPTLGQVDP
ncbi:ATP-binding protein [Streptomyces sp. NPDC051572]|uniref:ATP-binding protein n=1 Tax=Streptomyces sp. NPDC051572 TaxID=3155802 RepID=UPI003450B8F9